MIFILLGIIHWHLAAFLATTCIQAINVRKMNTRKKKEKKKNSKSEPQERKKKSISLSHHRRHHHNNHHHHLPTSSTDLIYIYIYIE